MRLPAIAGPHIPSRQLGAVLLTLAVLVLLEGCATGHALGGATSGFGLHSRSNSLRYGTGPWRPDTSLAPVKDEDTGGAGGFPEPATDAFQVAQEASGLGEEARHPAGAALQRLGQPELKEGQWTAGGLAVGDFYFSRQGVFYPVTQALRRADSPPLAELGLGRDPLNAALDGAQDAMGEMAVALANSVLHPIRGVEDLVQLPDTVARLIVSSPEYFARYGTMSREDQIREAARLSTHVLMLLGGGEAAVGRIGGLGAQLPVLSLSAEGQLVLVAGGTTTATLSVDLGALSILHMAGSGQGNTGGGKAGKSKQTTSAQGPGKWTYKTPTTESERSRDYQEQVTGRPAWWVYMVGEVEFDGFKPGELLEAKGPGYCAFFNPDGTPKSWYVKSGKFDQMLRQAEDQSRMAQRVGLPVTWHVADANVAQHLRKIFKKEGWKNITVRHTRSAP